MELTDLGWHHFHAATVIVPDENLKAQVSRGRNSEELAESNLMALPASIAAYEKEGDWLHALQRRLLKNKLIVEKIRCRTNCWRLPDWFWGKISGFIAETLPKILLNWLLKFVLKRDFIYHPAVSITETEICFHGWTSPARKWCSRMVLED